MSITLTTICVAALCLLIVIWIKRVRDGHELEMHSITPEALHTLLASNQEVRVFDVRQPLDLLANTEIIPGATRIPPKDVLQNRPLIPKDKSFTALAPVIKPAESSCVERVPCISCGSSFSKVDWRPGKRKGIRSSHTKSLSTLTRQTRSVLQLWWL